MSVTGTERVSPTPSEKFKFPEYEFPAVSPAVEPVIWKLPELPGATVVKLGMIDRNVPKPTEPLMVTVAVVLFLMLIVCAAVWTLEETPKLKVSGV